MGFDQWILALFYNDKRIIKEEYEFKNKIIRIMEFILMKLQNFYWGWKFNDKGNQTPCQDLKGTRPFWSNLSPLWPVIIFWDFC